MVRFRPPAHLPVLRTISRTVYVSGTPPSPHYTNPLTVSVVICTVTQCLTPPVVIFLSTCKDSFKVPTGSSLSTGNQRITHSLYNTCTPTVVPLRLTSEPSRNCISTPAPSRSLEVPVLKTYRLVRRLTPTASRTFLHHSSVTAQSHPRAGILCQIFVKNICVLNIREVEQ